MWILCLGILHLKRFKVKNALYFILYITSSLEYEGYSTRKYNGEIKWLWRWGNLTPPSKDWYYKPPTSSCYWTIYGIITSCHTVKRPHFHNPPQAVPIRGFILTGLTMTFKFSPPEKHRTFLPHICMRFKPQLIINPRPSPDPSPTTIVGVYGYPLLSHLPYIPAPH